MEPGGPPTWRPAFPVARPPGPLRVLWIPAVLTLLAIPLDLLAWLSGALDLVWTVLFWEGLLWGGVLLHFAGTGFERGRRDRKSVV